MEEKLAQQRQRRQMYKSKKIKLLQSGVESLYHEKVLCDVQLQVGGKIFSVHRTILAAMSDYFRAMLGGGFKESNKIDKPIVLEGISAVGFEVILDGIYTMELKLTIANILDVIPIACMLQIKPIIEECEDFLISSMEADNVFSHAVVAERFSLNKAMEYSAEYKKACFPEILQTLEFKELDAQEVVNYLSIPDLFLHGKEMTVFDAAIGWLEHKPNERKNHVLDVFGCVNLLQISQTDITDNVSKLDVIMDNTECAALVNEALKYHEEVLTQPFYEGKIVNTRGVKDGMIVFPGWYGGKPGSSLVREQYCDIFGNLDPKMACWKYLSIEHKQKSEFWDSHIPQNRVCTDYATSKMPGTFDILGSDGVVKVGNFLYTFKIEDLYHTSSKIIPYRYNPNFNEWITLEPAWTLHPKVDTFCVGQCSNKHILLIGSEAHVLDAYTFYYIYSILDNSWKKGKAEINLDGCVYMLYHNGATYIITGDNTLFSYNMEKDEWSELCKISLSENAIGDCEFVAHDKSLFVLPSRHDPSCFEYNVDTKCSTVFPNPILSTNCTNIYHSFTLGNYVYVILCYSRYFHDILEEHRTKLYYFDPSTRCYTLVRHLPCSCDYLYAAPMILPRP